MKIEFDLDVLKPHSPSLPFIAREIEQIKGVRFVSIKVDEIDQKTTSVFITVKGTGEMNIEEITQSLEELNCAVHSIDRVQIENWR
ncbi:MAG: hypothetical protein EU539_03500 [Promethearchaeota archaeon]|nr:MAG: hypothetical protein EU539_03500 [Candidatus Lokiarchaeota archaeon]